ncbi:MAG: hypothetical protein AVDCRST_MAG89-2087, partial [uncultured Gemmatimonadetes bacterium]
HVERNRNGGWRAAGGVDVGVGGRSRAGRRKLRRRRRPRIGVGGRAPAGRIHARRRPRREHPRPSLHPPAAAAGGRLSPAGGPCACERGTGGLPRKRDPLPERGPCSLCV